MVAGAPPADARRRAHAARGDVVCFPAGPAGGHEVSGPGTVLIISAESESDAIEYPELGKLELRPPGRLFRVATPSTSGMRRASRSISSTSLSRAIRATLRATASVASFGEAIGASRLGGSVYELDPGESICPYHYENTEEEWLLVLAGTPTLRDPDGEHELIPGDTVASATPGGAHKVTNRSDAVARILIFSTIPETEVSISVYPDSEKLSVWPPGKRLRMAESLDYWDGEA